MKKPFFFDLFTLFYHISSKMTHKRRFHQYAKPVWDYLLELTNLSDHLDICEAEKDIRDNVYFRGPNVYILFFAIIIASVGLNVNSIPVIIGAMLVSPLMGPIMGFGMGLGINDTRLVTDALKNLAVMVSISILASTLYFLITPLDLTHPSELLARTNPTIYDVLIALFGGFAGILETSRKERGTVISGVAIATALMPPLCTVGYGLANWNLRYAGGALYLFLLNGILIALATYLTVKFLGYPKVHEEATNARRRNVSIALLILLVLIPSVFSAIKVVRENQFEIRATEFAENHRFIGSSYIYNFEINADQAPQTIEFFLAGEKLTDEERTDFYIEALRAGFREEQIVLRDNATSDIREKLSDEELLRDLLESKDAQIELLKQQIDALQKQIDAFEQPNASDTLPADSPADSPLQ